MVGISISSDLNTDVDETEDIVVTLQQRIIELEAINNLLLESMTLLEDAMETTNQNVMKLESGLNELESGLNDTNAVVENLEDEAQGNEFKISYRFHMPNLCILNMVCILFLE